MKNGQIVETIRHRKYSKINGIQLAGPLSAEPEDSPPAASGTAETMAETDALRVWFPIQRGLLKRTVGHVKAINAASISVRRGEAPGIVGESGSGKTALALAIMRLIPSEGAVLFQGGDIQDRSSRAPRPLGADMQIVFQDPYGSLSPRMTVEQIVSEGLGAHGVAPGRNRRGMVADILTDVGLLPDMMDRYPHEFSGGQCQRIAVARAMIPRPKLLVLDEPTSTLDMTMRVQIVDLLRDLQSRHRLAYLFISHDLKVVRALSHRVILMRNGDVVEEGNTETIFEDARHPHTRELVAAAFDERAGTVRVDISPRPAKPRVDSTVGTSPPPHTHTDSDRGRLIRMIEAFRVIRFVGICS